MQDLADHASMSGHAWAPASIPRGAAVPLPSNIPAASAG
jgi:hypothetical protein